VDVVRNSLVHNPGVPILESDLVQQASGLTLDWDFSNAVRLTMLTVTVVPLALAMWTYFVGRRRS
ncbi:arabinose ABC transporter permease, partial [Mycobacterium sp. Y57]|nr:arabinose ABC transporter permease [Mycolicibacterium xanthum]